jgi:hypothetical protein
MKEGIWPKHHPNPEQQLLKDIDRKVDKLVTTVEEVQTAIAALTTDLEADAAAAQAEFLKLEKEVEEGKPVTGENLTPLKEAIEALDARVKTAEGDIPTT